MKDEYFGEVIYIYTSAQAEADDILVDIIKINPKWINGIFNYITTNLLHKGYFDNDKINIPNLLDLLNQALQIIYKNLIVSLVVKLSYQMAKSRKFLSS